MSAGNVFAVLAATRIFALVAVGAPAIASDRPDALLPVVGLAALWAWQTRAITRRDWRQALSPAQEAVAVGALCAVGGVAAPSVLAALVVPPLYATTIVGLGAMARVLALQLTVVAVGGLLTWRQAGQLDVVGIITWALAGAVISIVADRTMAEDRRRARAVAPYENAQQLLRRLINLSDDLSSGLEVGAIAGHMLHLVGDALPHRGLMLLVSRGDSLVPVASVHELDEDQAAACLRAAQALRGASPALRRDDVVAFRVSDTAVVAGLLPTSASPEPSYADLVDLLAPDTVKLETALMFARFRDAAAAEERQRLAREMHDGVAQDIASLGYLVDAIAARSGDEQQARQLRLLRERVTGVVAEVRASVTTLRTSVGENESLGGAISAVARHLSEASGIPVRVRLDEHPTRLRPEVEAELFRITQEAINNAVKHARATAIEVMCEVYAPEARITVVDNGVGLQPGRSDSHGLQIMRERADLIGARLQVTNNASRGLTVSVRLSAPARVPVP